MGLDHRNVGRIHPGLAAFWNYHPMVEWSGSGMGSVSIMASAKNRDYLDRDHLSGLPWLLATIRAHDIQPHVHRPSNVLRLVGIDALGNP